MPKGFNGYRPIYLNVNTYGQNQNCYYCTVAALHNLTTTQLVQRTVLMMQDTATTDEITQLFKDAGSDVVVGRDLNDGQVQAAVNIAVQLGHAAGLAYNRPNGSGHMVVLRRMFGSFECLDYQLNYGQQGRELGFPPEPNIASYHLFLLA